MYCGYIDVRGKKRCGTQSILFWEFKIILMINEIVFLMLLQYCNSIKVIYVNSQNNTIKNSKKENNFKCPFLLNQWLENKYSF
jgi:hypothetical protein